MKTIRGFLAASVLCALAGFSGAATKQLTVKAVNKLPFARPNQTIELSARDLAPLGEKDLERIHIRDAAGKDLLCQAVDTDGDYTADEVIFQTDFAPGEAKTFTVATGEKQVYTKDQFKAYGRFIRERFDDFAWENDRIAHRTYGKALETWQREPLASSAIDIWSKRTPRLVINDWYMLDNYHTDAGEGGDFYSAGLTRGCGGDGLWAADKLWVSRNFVQSHVLANGPIRVMFDLTYEPFDVDGISVGEVKRVTLDVGQNLNHYESFYIPFTRPEKPVSLTAAIGLKKVKGEKTELNTEHGWLVKLEPMESNAGHQGLALVFDAKLFEKMTEDKLNLVVLEKVPDDKRVSFWAGFYWDKSGQFADDAAWKAYVDQFAQGLLSPIQISVSGE